MEGGRVQEKEENGKEEVGEDGRHRWRKGEERGDRGYTGQDYRRAEIERRRGHNEEGTDSGIKDGHAPSQTANIRGDLNAKRGSKDVVRRRARNGQAEDPVDGDRRRVHRDEEGHDGRYHHLGPWRQGQGKGVAARGASDRGVRPDRGKSRGSNEDGGAEDGLDRHRGG
jgi:hypothetical protein